MRKNIEREKEQRKELNLQRETRNEKMSIPYLFIKIASIKI